MLGRGGRIGCVRQWGPGRRGAVPQPRQGRAKALRHEALWFILSEADHSPLSSSSCCPSSPATSSSFGAFLAALSFGSPHSERPLGGSGVVPAIAAGKRLRRSSWKKSKKYRWKKVLILALTHPVLTLTRKQCVRFNVAHAVLEYFRGREVIFFNLQARFGFSEGAYFILFYFFIRLPALRTSCTFLLLTLRGNLEKINTPAGWKENASSFAWELYYSVAASRTSIISLLWIFQRHHYSEYSNIWK